MSESAPPPAPTPKDLWIIVVLFVISCAPLAFLDLEVASQIASALALPLAVTLAALPVISASMGIGVLFPWRRLLTVSATVMALLGVLAVGHAAWQNTKDLDVELSGHVSADGTPWTHGGVATLVLPGSGSPPARDNLTLAVSLDNVDESGDCERTALLDFVPVLDGREGRAVRVAPRTSVTIPFGGVRNTAQVKVIIHYEAANTACKVRMHIEEAVLHD